MWRNEIQTKTNQVTSHSNWPRVLLFDLAHKQCNGIIKWWLHFLTWESKGRFWLSMMSDHAANPIFFNKKIKIGRSEHSQTPQPPTSDNILFLPPPSVKVDVICVSPLTNFTNSWNKFYNEITVYMLIPILYQVKYYIC